jgi:Na+/melibiose symporter-like transporter
MGTMYTLFITSIIIFILGEGIIFFGKKERHSIAWVMVTICAIGFGISLYNLLTY